MCMLLLVKHFALGHRQKKEAKWQKLETRQNSSATALFVAVVVAWGHSGVDVDIKVSTDQREKGKRLLELIGLLSIH